MGIADLWNTEFSSVAQSCLTLCDPVDCSSPGLSVHHQLPEFTQTHIHGVGDAIQPSHPHPHRRLTQTCLWVSRSLQWRCGSAVACCWVGGTECSSVCMGSFEGGHHYLHYLHHTLPQVNSRERTQLHPSTENLIKDLLSMAPPIRTRPSFPLSQSLPSGSFHKPLILLHQREDRLKTTVTNQSKHMDHSLV